MPEGHAVAGGSRRFMTCSETVFSGAEAMSIGPSSTRARSFPSSNAIRTDFSRDRYRRRPRPFRVGCVRSQYTRPSPSSSLIRRSHAAIGIPNRRPRSIADAGRSNVPRRMRAEYSSMIVWVTCRLPWFSLPFEREDARDEAGDLVRFERLVQVPDRPPAHALNLGEGVSKRRHEDRAEPGFRPAGRLDELDAVRTRHAVIGEEEIHAVLPHRFHCPGRAPGRQHGIPDQTEQLRQVLAHPLVVADDEDARSDGSGLRWQGNHRPSRVDWGGRLFIPPG